MIEIIYTPETKIIKNEIRTKTFDIDVEFSEMKKFITSKDDVIVYTTVQDLMKIRSIVGNNEQYRYEIYRDNVKVLDNRTIKEDIRRLKDGSLKYVCYRPKNTKLMGKKVYIKGDNVKLKVNELCVPLKDLKRLQENVEKYLIMNVFNGKVVEDDINC